MFACYGGWYWEAWAAGQRVNGGIERVRADAQRLGDRAAAIAARQASKGRDLLEPGRFRDEYRDWEQDWGGYQEA